MHMVVDPSGNQCLATQYFTQKSCVLSSRVGRLFKRAAAVARAPADGYTLLLGGTLTHLNETLLKNRLLYNPVKDLDPIASVAANSLCIAVHPTVPVQSLNELIAYARTNPGKLSYGHAGVGSIQHLTGELFKSLAGTPEIVQVPYRIGVLVRSSQI